MEIKDKILGATEEVSKHRLSILLLCDFLAPLPATVSLTASQKDAGGLFEIVLL